MRGLLSFLLVAWCFISTYWYACHFKINAENKVTCWLCGGDGAEVIAVAGPGAERLAIGQLIDLSGHVELMAPEHLTARAQPTLAFEFDLAIA